MPLGLLPLMVLLAVVLVLWAVSWSLLRLFHRLFSSGARKLSRSSARVHADTLRAGLHRRAPRTANWLEARLNPGQFTGLPLTLIVLAAAYLASLLGGIVEELIEAEGLSAVDEGINTMLTPYRTDAVVAAFTWVTDLGGSSALTAVAIVTTGLIWVHGHGYMVLPLWITLLGSQITTYSGKFAFGRARPEFVTEVTAATPSFPSGHATGSMAVYGFIAYIIARDLVTVRQRFEIIYWAIVLIAAIGFSRMILSVHYASDVAAGFLVGGFWLLVGFAVAEQLRRRARHRVER